MKSDDVDQMIDEMTANKMRERTRQLAEQAGFVLWYGAERRYRKKQIAVDWASNYDDELEQFAELVRADEREACAKVAEAFDPEQKMSNYGQVIASRIRARGDDDIYDIYDIWVETPCKTHPDAPHGFDRNASHSADRYVCECEGWEPQSEPPLECQTEEEKTAFAFGWWKAMETKRQWVGLTDKETQYLVKHFDWRQSADHFVALIEAKLKEKNGG